MSSSIINRTHHPITILPADAPASAIDQATIMPAGPRGDRARVRTNDRVVGDVAGICSDCNGDGVHVLALASPDQLRPSTDGAVWVRFRDLYRLERLCEQCQGTGWEAAR